VFETGALDKNPVLLDAARLRAALALVRLPSDSTGVSFVIAADGTIELPSLGQFSKDARGLPEARAVLGGARVFSPGIRRGSRVRTSVDVLLVYSGPGSDARLGEGSWVPDKSDAKERAMGLRGRGSASAEIVLYTGPDVPQPLVDVPPRLINGEAVDQLLRTRGVPVDHGPNGTRALALVRMRITPQGTVDSSSVRLESASDHGDAALAAARILRFSPPSTREKQVEAWVLVTLHYPQPLK
jgi:TonB family protein